MLERQSIPEGSELARELRELADAVRRGEPARLHLRAPPDQAELRWALHGLLEAVEAREQEHRAKAANGEQVMLAFEELARDQAAELARQNEELRRQNEELRVASRHKTEFVTTVSHELRSPLNSVIGFSEMLLQGYAGRLSGEQGEYVGDIHRAGRHLLRLIDDILDLAKVEAGRMEFQRLLFDLSVPVREAEEIARGMALKKGQTLRLETQGFVPCVGDLHRVRQVVLNLLSNAVKFTPEGGEIVVRVERVGDPRRGAREGLGHRDLARAPPLRLRGVPPGRRRRQAHPPGHRPRARAGAPLRRADGRVRRAREPERRGRDLQHSPPRSRRAGEGYALNALFVGRGNFRGRDSSSSGRVNPPARSGRSR